MTILEPKSVEDIDLTDVDLFLHGNPHAAWGDLAARGAGALETSAATDAATGTSRATKT